MSRSIKILPWVLSIDVVVTFVSIFLVYKFVQDERLNSMLNHAVLAFTQGVSTLIVISVMFWRVGAKDR